MKRSLTRARPASAIRCRSAGSFSARTIASASACGSRVGTSAATLPTTGDPCGSQNASCTFTGAAAAACSTSIPSCTVTVRSAATPSATSICRIASDAAMKQSTWRYFQRENELPFRWKSTRRAATSAGIGAPLAAADPIDSASAAIATPCGSCAWTTSGASRLMTRENFQAAERSISVRGAIGIRSSPSTARRRSSPSG